MGDQVMLHKTEVSFITTLIIPRIFPYLGKELVGGGEAGEDADEEVVQVPGLLLGAGAQLHQPRRLLPRHQSPQEARQGGQQPQLPPPASSPRPPLFYSHRSRKAD